MQFRIYFEDTDAMGIVYHANYLKFCERARSEAFFRAGLGAQLAGSGGFVLSECACKFHESARLGDVICVHTKVAKISRASCIIEQEIRLNKRVLGEAAKADALLFSASLKLANIDANGRASAMSEEAKKLLLSL